MKKFLLCVLMVLVMATAACADGNKLFITTIKDCKLDKVQDVIVDKMTARNFTINDITPYKMVFIKSFQEMFGYQRNSVIFNLVARDNNIKLMVSQQVYAQDGFGSSGIGDKNIAHLIPIIKEIKNAIDGTPIDQIENEAVNQLPEAGNKPEKKLGLVISDKGEDGKYRVKSVEAGSIAADKGIYINDVIIDINGNALAQMDKSAIDSYIANKWGAGSSLVFTVEHEGQQKMITVKRETK